MPIPYADLQIAALDVPATGDSGRSLQVSWTITNAGIGRTDTEEWADTLALTSNPDGTGMVWLGSFDHLGVLAPGTSYTRTVDLPVPNGLSGTFYVQLRTAGPFEFIYTDNNSAISGPVTISLSPSPDLVVSNIVAPTAATEGS